MAQPELEIDAVMAVLSPHLSLLSGCVRRGFETYQTEYPPLVRAAHDNAAAAKCVHRHVLYELQVALHDVRGLALLDVRGLNVLNLHDRAVIRFKKMDEAGQSQSYPTEQERNFARQLHLPGLPPTATRLTFGYEPDLAFSSIVRVLVACPLGAQVHWCAQVNDVEGAAQAWTDITPRRLPGTERYKRYGTDDV